MEIILTPALLPPLVEEISEFSNSALKIISYLQNYEKPDVPQSSKIGASSHIQKPILNHSFVCHSNERPIRKYQDDIPNLPISSLSETCNPNESVDMFDETFLFDRNVGGDQVNSETPKKCHVNRKTTFDLSNSNRITDYFKIIRRNMPHKIQETKKLGDEKFTLLNSSFKKNMKRRKIESKKIIQPLDPGILSWASLAKNADKGGLKNRLIEKDNKTIEPNLVGSSKPTNKFVNVFQIKNFSDDDL